MEVVKLDVKGADVEDPFPAKKSSLLKKVKSLAPLRSPVIQMFKGLKFIGQRDGWVDVEKRFNKLTAQTDGMLKRSDFCKCIGMEKSKEFADKLFATLARKQAIHRDSITRDEFKSFWDQISDQRFEIRLQIFFNMMDKDADGKINAEELKDIIILSGSTNKLANIQEQAVECAASIMKELDPDSRRFIKIDHLLNALLKEPSHCGSSGGDGKNLSHMLSKTLKPKSETNALVTAWESGKYFVLENWKRIWVVALWIGAMSGLFAYKYVQYRNKAAYQVMGECVCMAKGAAETLKLNMALILLPVCRNTITWLRNKTKLGSLVPLDDNLNFHQVIAIGIAVGTGIHVLAHMSCDFPRLIRASSNEYRPMEPFFGKHQHKSYFHFVKSVEGVTGIVMVVLMAIAFTLAAPCFRIGKPDDKPKLIRKLTGFNAFWYSHHLFVIVYALLVVHGIYLYLIHEWYRKTTWMYLAVPVTLYVCERLIRALRSSIKDVNVKKVDDYPANVLALQMTKPKDFTYKSGQYMFLKCKAVSPFEWHPFSITSSPSDEYLSVHIRALGDWTKQLRTIFLEARKSMLGGESGLLEEDCLQGYPEVLIDGPYGAPAQEYKKYEVVLLVGLGIGATPMISIVKDIVNNMKAMESKGNDDPKNGSCNSREEFKTKKVYFYWVTGEQGSFDWFKDVLDKVEELDRKDVIEIHNHCTSIYEEGDARSVLIAMLQVINHAKDGKDIVTGARAKAQFARPNWHHVCERISNNHDTPVGVFYCGPPKAAKELKHQASEFSRKNRTQFVFHKENF